MNRSGVALIIAISVLAALLFLALPFVFSQSASVAGARAASWDGASRRGSDRSLGLATALSTYATALHRSPGLATQLSVAQLTYVQLPGQIGDFNGPIRYPSDAPNSWRSIIATGEPWSTTSGVLAGPDSAGAVHGATIEDESRRIEPNCLDMYGWAVVLKRAGIQDPWTVAWHWDLTKPNKGVWTKVTFGRLARALTYWRPGNGSRRFNRLEDMLGADPQQPENWYGVASYLGCVHFGPLHNYPSRGQSGWPPGLPGQANVEGQAVEGTRNAAETDPEVKFNDDNGNGKWDAGETDTDNLGWRVAPLTQAELERLRPLLSFLIPGQGRSGLIDLGTVVAAENRSGDWWGVVTDELSPPDTGMVGGAIRTNRTWTHSGTASNRHLDNGWAREGDPLAVDAIPALNLNTVPSDSGMTRLYLAQDYATGESDGAYQARIEALNWPNDPIDTPITTIGHMPLLRWLDPRTGDGVIGFERPPLGIAGFGIVAVEGLATIRDAQGNAVASRRRRTVVQAVPQERPIEASWTTQGDFEGLVRLRHGSWVVAGPHPTNRISDWGADSSTGRQDMLALDGPGWLEPAPLTSFGNNPSASIDWRVPFGLTKTQTWAEILWPVVGNAPVATAKPTTGDEPTQMRSIGTNVGALTAQGLRLRNGDVLAYDIANGPLRCGGAGVNGEMSPRHVSMRFCIPSISAGDVVTLLEVRNQVDGADSDSPDRPSVLPAAPASGFGKPDASTDLQNLWRVEYDDGAKQLVLVIANAALPWRSGATGERNRFGVDQWGMETDADPGAVADLRCTSADQNNYPFAPGDPASRVEFRYKVPSGLRAGQWYHLQAFCLSDRPGLHGLALDGVVGRDLTAQPIITTAQTRLGDHYTFPSLRLVGDITEMPDLPKSLGGQPLAAPGWAGTVAVSFPAELKIADVLPIRGQVRIDDEYFSYTGISDGAVGQGQLTGVQRARRVRTSQVATKTVPAIPPAVGTVTVNDEDFRWPALQQHADGALVVPGWHRIDQVTGNWLRGYGLLSQDFLHDPVSGTSNSISQLPPTGSSITITPSTGAWPAAGIVKLTYTSTSLGTHTTRASFTGPGNLTLNWSGIAPVAAAPPTANDITSVTAVLISMAIEGVVDDMDLDGNGVNERMWNDAAQLLDLDTGRCEWVRITGVSNQGAGGRFLLNDGGWAMPPAPITPDPRNQARGAMRTPWRSDAWPGIPGDVSRTLVLPVQNLLPRTFRLESGDVATVVPDQVVSGIRREPVQVVVRQAARDGYPAAISDGGATQETTENWFALTHRVPDVLPDPITAPDTQTFLIGRGWSGDDLSAFAASPPRRGALPRKDHLAQAGGGPARIYIGSSDRRTTRTQDVIIDDLCAGESTGVGDANDQGAVGCGIIQIDGNPTGRLSSAASDLPVTVMASQPIFQSPNNYGLVLIDGEVFAWRKNGDNNHADLIARALLGTRAASHSLGIPAAAQLTVLGAAPGRTVQPSLPAYALPMGPVAELCSPLAAGAHNVGVDVVEVPYGNYYKDPVDFTHPSQDSYANDPHLIMRPPFVLCHDPADGDTVEVMRLFYRPASTQRITARWLRGVYGTTDTTWTAPYTPATHVGAWSPIDPGAQPVTPQLASNPPMLNPIMIGWWPRFAPGQTGSPPVEALRSRSFSWAGFALRLSGSRFDPYGVPALKSAVGGIADVGVAADGGCTVTASALAAEEATGVVFDWDKAWLKRVSLSQSANAGLTDPFNWDRFQLREADGAELRIHWAAPTSAATGLLRAADASGRTPRLENVRLRCVAPNRVLAVEEVR